MISQEEPYHQKDLNLRPLHLVSPLLVEVVMQLVQERPALVPEAPGDDRMVPCTFPAATPADVML